MRNADWILECGLSIADSYFQLLREWNPQSAVDIQKSNPHSAIRVPQYAR